MDGYGAKFLKTTWSIVKHDFIAAVRELFVNENMYSAINNTLVFQKVFRQKL